MLKNSFPFVFLAKTSRLSLLQPSITNTDIINVFDNREMARTTGTPPPLTLFAPANTALDPCQVLEPLLRSNTIPFTSFQMGRKSRIYPQNGTNVGINFRNIVKLDNILLPFIEQKLSIALSTDDILEEFMVMAGLPHKIRIVSVIFKIDSTIFPHPPAQNPLY